MRPELENQNDGSNSRAKPNHKGLLGTCTARFQGVVMGVLETFFYKYGKFVARYDTIVTKQVLYHYFVRKSIMYVNILFCSIVIFLGILSR